MSAHSSAREPERPPVPASTAPRAPHPSGSAPATALALQRSIGNAATARLLARARPLQRTAIVYEHHKVAGTEHEDTDAFLAGLDNLYPPDSKGRKAALAGILATFEKLERPTAWDEEQMGLLRTLIAEKSPTSAVEPVKADPAADPAAASATSGSSGGGGPVAVALAQHGKRVPLETSSKDDLVWACAVLNEAGVLQPLLREVHAQRRPADVDAWRASMEAEPDPNQAVLIAVDDGGTSYSFDLHIIYAKAAKVGSETLHRLVFELCNAKARPLLETVERAAAAGDLGAVAYAYAKEGIEALSETEHDKYLEDLIKLGKSRERSAKGLRGRAGTLGEYLMTLGVTPKERLELQLKGSKPHAVGYVGQWDERHFDAYRGKKGPLEYGEWLLAGDPSRELKEVEALRLPNLEVDGGMMKSLMAAVFRHSGSYLQKRFTTKKRKAEAAPTLAPAAPGHRSASASSTSSSAASSD